jgi:protease I
VLTANGHEDAELWYPVLRLREEGAEVTLVGAEAKEYHGEHGYPAKAEIAAKNVRVQDFDAVFIPGGQRGPDNMRLHPELARLVREAHDAGKVVAAICHGPWMLASAEIIQGRRVTSWPSVRIDLAHAGGEWIDREVVVDGNIITARKPEDLPAFARELVRALEGV